MHISHDTMLSMALILSSLTVAIKINLVSFRSMLFVLRYWRLFQDVYVRVDAFDSFHLPYFHNVYCVLCVRAKIMSNIISHLDSISNELIILNQKRIDLDSIAFETMNKFENLLRKAYFPFALISFCIQSSVFVAILSNTCNATRQRQTKKCMQKTTEKKQSEHQIDRYESERASKREAQRDNYVVGASAALSTPRNTFRSNFVAYFLLIIFFSL